MRLTDGQTDRQTDRILIARPRLHSMQRGKNHADYATVVQMLDMKGRLQLEGHSSGTR